MQRNMTNTIFLTGATGLVGRNLVPRLLKADPTCRLILLIRAGSENEAKLRLDDLLWHLWHQMDPASTEDRIEVIRGDITLESLGIPQSIYEKLASEVTHVVHSAANVQFQLPIAAARGVNLEGTKNVARFAWQAHANGILRNFAYISTAFVSGDREGVVYEDELDCGQRFSNTYEQSKFEAERFIRERIIGLPVTVFRPSIIVGDSKSGATCSFNVVYPALKMISRGLVRMFPCLPEATLDIVPVDYVCDAITHILTKVPKGIGFSYHLTAGKHLRTRADQIADLAITYFNKKIPNRAICPIHFASQNSHGAFAQSLNHYDRRIIQAMNEYMPYLDVEQIFDDSNARWALRGSGIIAPPFAQYYQSILDYCLETEWGKRQRQAA